MERSALSCRDIVFMSAGVLVGVVVYFSFTKAELGSFALAQSRPFITNAASLAVSSHVNAASRSTTAIKAHGNRNDIVEAESAVPLQHPPQQWPAVLGTAVLACTAFLAGLLGGRRWRRQSDMAIASSSGYSGDYFRLQPQSKPGRLQPLWGRRSAKIALTKGKEDQRRAKLYARFGKKIIMAVKAGGSTDESANLQLREVIREARDANVPLANIERAIKRGSDTGSADYKESIFEAYGKGGAGVIIVVLSDNANRAATDVRTTAGRAGLTAASPGSVAFNFKRTGAIVCPKAVSEDLAIEAAMDADADDVEVKEGDEGEWLVLTDPKHLMALKAALTSRGVECGEVKLVFNPTNTVECSAADEEVNLLAIEKLEDLDDVDAVFHNMA